MGGLGGNSLFIRSFLGVCVGFRFVFSEGWRILGELVILNCNLLDRLLDKEIRVVDNKLGVLFVYCVLDVVLYFYFFLGIVFRN